MGKNLYYHTGVKTKTGESLKPYTAVHNTYTVHKQAELINTVWGIMSMWKKLLKKTIVSDLYDWETMYWL